VELARALWPGEWPAARSMPSWCKFDCNQYLLVLGHKEGVVVAVLDLKSDEAAVSDGKEVQNL